MSMAGVETAAGVTSPKFCSCIASRSSPLAPSPRTAVEACDDADGSGAAAVALWFSSILEFARFIVGVRPLPPLESRRDNAYDEEEEEEGGGGAGACKFGLSRVNATAALHINNPC